MPNKKNLLVTSYINPDLDGFACAFSYAEFLRKRGKNARAIICGKPSEEAQFVLHKFKIPTSENDEKMIDYFDKIIIVDVSDLNGLSGSINPKKVIEVIDHRKIHGAHKFPHAKIQIELVGSAATLIAEKFYHNKILVSEKSAALLFSAIVSNTVNFQANVTTKRDYEMADWLKTNFSLPKNYVYEMFHNKSQFKKSLEEVFIDEFVTFHFNNYRLGIVQLEIVNVDEFIRENLIEIKKVLEKLKKEKSLDIIFLTCIDLEKAFNEIVVDDDVTQKFLEQTLEITFKNKVSKRNGILMRKEIVPLCKDVLESSK